MPYRLKFEFLCDDHRLKGVVERELEEKEVWASTFRQLIDSSRNEILKKYPYIEDAIDFIVITGLHLENF